MLEDEPSTALVGVVGSPDGGSKTGMVCWSEIWEETSREAGLAEEFTKGGQSEEEPACRPVAKKFWQQGEGLSTTAQRNLI